VASGNTLATLGFEFKQSEQPNGALFQRVGKRDAIVFPYGASPSLATPRANSEMVWELVLPATYASTTGLTFNIPFGCRSPNNGGNVVIGVSAESMAADTAGQSYNVDAFGTEVTATVAVPTTNMDGVKYTTIALPKANFGTPAAGILIRIKVRRVLTNAADTANHDLLIFPIEVRET
jgi:hypothetical protein